VTMKGTVRTLDEALRGKMEKWIPEVAQQTAAGYGCEAKVTYSRGCPPLRHDRELTSLAEKALREWLGPERVLMREKPMMGAEDFAYFAERVPSTQVVLGIKSSADAPKVSFHQSKFIVDERCIAVGVEAFCAIALACLGADEG